ncbi:hypothetical protein COLO4_00632 [Corchorus olitorius]|uniref:Uncharacterized protein n=1 Tax=Corchorus olitorius TaxID=93759 RepID=A0A1R3L3Q7_9ROSI|nr:hypothetical protein COLO4_00632 [Corchorus olitorius]
MPVARRQAPNATATITSATSTSSSVNPSLPRTLLHDIAPGPRGDDIDLGIVAREANRDGGLDGFTPEQHPHGAGLRRAPRLHERQRRQRLTPGTAAQDVILQRLPGITFADEEAVALRCRLPDDGLRAQACLVAGSVQKEDELLGLLLQDIALARLRVDDHRTHHDADDDDHHQHLQQCEGTRAVTTADTDTDSGPQAHVSAHHLVDVENRHQHRQHDQQHHHPHAEDERRLQQARDEQGAALKLARFAFGGTVKHGREVAGGFARADEMHQHRREPVGLRQRTRERGAFTHAADGVFYVMAQDDVVQRFSRRLQRPQDRHPRADQDGERAGKARGVVAAHEPPDQWRAQQPAMPCSLRAGSLQQPLDAHHHAGDKERRKPAPVPRKVAAREHNDGQRRQLLLGRRKHAHHLRHDISQQEDHDAECHDGHDGGVGEGQLDLLREGVAAFDVVGQTCEHHVQLARVFACGNEGAIDVGKVARVPGQCAGKRLAADHLGTQRADQVAHVVAFGFSGQRGERFVQRQARRQQTGKLPREQRLFCRAEPRAQQPEATARGALRHRRYVDRSHAARAQQRPRTAAAVRVDDATAKLSGRRNGLVAEGRHELERAIAGSSAKPDRL